MIRLGMLHRRGPLAVRPGALAAVGVCLAALSATLPAWASCTALGVVSCSATVTAAPLPFGNYNPSTGTTKDVSSSITVTGTVYGVGLLTTIGYTISMSAGASGNVSDRRMTGGSGGPSLGYNLYTGNAYDTVWGNATVSDSISALAAVLGTSASKSYTVYGRIAASQYVSFGAYTDTIIVQVDY